jgi:hypothetical protein
MRKDWGIIRRFAVSGLAIAAIFFVFFKTDSPRDSSMATGATWAACLLCPGFMWFVWAAAAEPQLPGLQVMWLMIALIHFALCAVIGAVLVGLRKRREKIAAN